MTSLPNIPDAAVEAAVSAAYEGVPAVGEDLRGSMRRILKAAAPHLMAQALDQAAENLDALWDERKNRMYEQRDWADGVEESEALVKKMAAEQRPAGAGE